MSENKEKIKDVFEFEPERALKKGATLGAGLAMKWLINYPFDFILYPVVLIWLGNVYGGFLMIILSVFLNLLIIRAYDWSKTDWLLIEMVKGLREGETSGRWSRFISKILKKSNTLSFFVLCLDDPITVTLYLRQGSNRYNGMSLRDYKIFFAATLVANLYWIIGWAAVIEVVKRMFF